MDWKSKLTSRKFWAAVAEFVTMIIVALHGTQETATQIAALIMAGAAVIAYIVGEGLVDSSRASGKSDIRLIGQWDENAENVEEVQPKSV